MATRIPVYYDDDVGLGIAPIASTDDIQLGGLEITGSGDITMNSGEVLGLPAIPSVDGAAASKAYVDTLSAGLPPRQSVRLATAAALPAYTPSGSGVGKTLTADANGALSLDSVAVAVSDRVLVKSEGATDADHGIYTVTQTGDGSNPWILTRATDMDENDEISEGVSCWVGEGSTLADTRWTIYTNNPINIEDAHGWTQTAGPGLFTEGDGISISGSTIAVDLAASSGLEFSGGDLKVDIVSTDRLSLSASGLDVVGLPSLFEINGVAVGATVTAANLDTLTDTSNADALHTHATGAAERLEDELQAYEALSDGDPIEWGGASNKIRKCQAATAATLDCFGVVEEDSGIGVDGTGTIVRRGVATSVVTGATVGDRFYVGDSGGLVARSSVSSGNYLVFVGTAVNATDLEVNPFFIGKKP